MCGLCSFIYETEHHNGIAELLEILGRYNCSYYYAVAFSEALTVFLKYISVLVRF